MFRSAANMLFSRKSQKFMYFSTVREIKKVAVVGLGLMGHGIAQVAAQAGYQVVAVEAKQEALLIGKNRIDDSMKKVSAREVKKGKISQSDADKMVAEVLTRITCTTDLHGTADCDMVIEAIAEHMPLKLDFYRNLGGIVKPGAIFASNTSSLAITGMAEVSGRANLFVGMHFFNPVQMMKLVEVIRTKHTEDAAYQLAVGFVKKIEKTSVECGDTPGFIVNRLLVPYMAQAMAMIDRKVASVGDIDVSMQLGAGHPMGPLHLADYVGLDTCLSILKGWTKEFPEEPSFFIPKVLEELNKNGHFGRKSGKGFYNWEGDKIGTPRM